LVSTSIAITASAHGDDGEADGGSLDAFLANSTVQAAASLLHTLGAIMLTSGLILFITTFRTEEDSEKPVVQMLRRIIGLGVGLNVAGGLIRVFTPGHPSVFDVFTDSWASYIFGKHLILIAVYTTCILALMERYTLEKRRRWALIAIVGVVVVAALGVMADQVGN
jgi:uncharacterized membrane protein HdeD (DUF308 family)